MDGAKFIFVTGGVISGLGKGITAASLGRLLKARGLKIFVQKLDPYMNVDPGTMSPFQHGEVFVTEDGAETDLDLGHYERFVDENFDRFSNLTSGRVYWDVLNKERKGSYLGKTIQVIPHITGSIKSFIYNGARVSGADLVIIEIGGTVGDIESQPFLEAIRQVSYEVGLENCVFIHVTLVPYLKSSNEHKSKPTQHSVQKLQSMGISPDIIVTRADEPIEQYVLQKIADLCNVKASCVIENATLACLYEAPIMLHEKGLDDAVCRELKLELPPPDLGEWKEMLDRIANRDKRVRIALVGKYVKLHDAYISVYEALQHAGYPIGAEIDVIWVDSEELSEKNVEAQLSGADGVIVPGGFGERGTEGMIVACQYARENDIPYFGLCLGMQIAVIEFARHVCGLKEANSHEFDETSPHLVIDFLPEQVAIEDKGGTMRLGKYPCKVKEGTIMSRAYRVGEISERHRHRYEFNNSYRKMMEDMGAVVSGESPDRRIVETFEIAGKRFFLGVQFHPEFKSRPNKPHPLFAEFVRSSLGAKLDP